jgi:hypothetical protein
MRRRLRDALLLFLTALLASQPLMVSASSIPSPQQKAMDATVDAGEAYIEHVGGAMLHAASSVKRIDAINAVDVETLSEGSLIQAREDLWNLAQSLSLVIGGAKELAQSVEALQLDPIEATDVQSDAQAGLPEETREDLSTYAGLSSAQVDGIESELAGRVQRRFAIASSGLPEENVVQLSNAGFTAGEIAEIESALSSWGLADSSLDTRQDQFNAARNEFAAGRSQALIAYVQLLGKQIRVRQANGIAPRAVTQEELDSLAQDELRLLIHAVHLQELWGDDPRLDIGDGDWWFIERYATRAAERLEEVILDSQNHGLVAELLFILHFASLAETARAGDPDYVKNELDAFVQLLSFETDAQAFVVDQRGRTHGLAKLVARVVSSEPIREHIEWSLEPAAVIVHADLIQHRLNTGDIFTSQSPAGAIEELDETNNQLGFLFAAGLEFWDQLDVNVLLVALDILEFINDGSMLAWIEAILTGDVETPAQFGATVLLGVIPVLGAIPDIISLVIDPSIFIKAVSIFGIICSLGDVLALLGLEPIAGVSFLGDAASAVIKGLFKYADEAAQFVLNSLKLKQAFNVILDFFKLTLKSVGDLGGSLDEVLEFLKKLFTGDFKLWDNFITFVRRVGADTLVKMGFDEGGDLIGRILRAGADLSDEAIQVVDEVGDGLASVGVRLGDDAAEGLGALGRVFDGSRFGRVVDGIGGACGFAGINFGVAKFAKIRMAGVCDPDLFQKVLANVNDWDDIAHSGFQKVTNNIIADDRLGRLLANYADDPASLGNALGFLGKSEVDDIVVAYGIKNADEIDGFVDLVSRGYDEDLLQRITRTVDGESPALVSRLENNGIGYLQDSLQEIDGLGLRYKVIGDDNWKTILDTDVDDLARNTRLFDEAELAEVGGIGSLPNRRGKIGEYYAENIFDDRLSANFIDRNVNVTGHEIDRVFRQGKDVIGVEVKNYSAAGSFDFWDLDNEIEKAVVAADELGVNKYVFFFTDDKMIQSVVDDLITAFGNVLPDIELVIIHGIDNF